MDRALGGDITDLVDFLHRTGKGAHHGGDRDLNALTHLDLVFIGVAEVEGEFQLLVVDQGGHSGALGDILVALERLHILQLAGEGGADRKVGGLVLKVGHVLVQLIQIFLGGVYQVLSVLAEDGVQGLTRGDSITGGDIDLTDGTSGGQRDSGGFLGGGGAAAGYGALDRADLNRLRLNLAVGVVLLGQKAV